VAWLSRAAAVSPGDVRIFTALADAQLTIGDRDAASKSIGRALEIEPQNGLARSLARRLTS
jgi:hypothetical protein